MPPVTRRSTGSVAKIRYHDLSSDSDEGNPVKREPKSRTTKKGIKREESDFEASSVDSSSSESEASSDSVVAVQEEPQEDSLSVDVEVIRGARNPSNIWKPVTKVPLFPQALINNSSEEVIGDCISYLCRFEDWRSELTDVLTSSFPLLVGSSVLKDDLEVLNVVLKFLDSKDTPPVSLFVHSSLRGFSHESIRAYFSNLQQAARSILDML